MAVRVISSSTTVLGTALTRQQLPVVIASITALKNGTNGYRAAPQPMIHDGRSNGHSRPLILPTERKKAAAKKAAPSAYDLIEEAQTNFKRQSGEMRKLLAAFATMNHDLRQMVAPLRDAQHDRMRLVRALDKLESRSQAQIIKSAKHDKRDVKKLLTTPNGATVYLAETLRGAQSDQLHAELKKLDATFDPQKASFAALLQKRAKLKAFIVKELNPAEKKAEATPPRKRPETAANKRARDNARLSKTEMRTLLLDPTRRDAFTAPEGAPPVTVPALSAVQISMREIAVRLTALDRAAIIQAEKEARGEAASRNADAYDGYGFDDLDALPTRMASKPRLKRSDDAAPKKPARRPSKSAAVHAARAGS
jgi:hypothetical protein